MNMDNSLKKTEAAFPGVELKAIQDDITIYGKPEKAWGALKFLRARLEENLHLKVNLPKCRCYGTTPIACQGKPDWLDEPKSLLDKSGNVLVDSPPDLKPRRSSNSDMQQHCALSVPV